MALFFLRYLIQTRMRSHPVVLGVWFLVGFFVYFHALLIAFVISTIISWAGSYACSSVRYNTHLYCLVVQAGFYSDAVECWTFVWRVAGSILSRGKRWLVFFHLFHAHVSLWHHLWLQTSSDESQLFQVTNESLNTRGWQSKWEILDVLLSAFSMKINSVSEIK